MYQIKDYLIKVALLAVVAPTITVIATAAAGIAAFVLIGILMVTSPVAALFATRGEGLNIRMGDFVVMAINKEALKFWR